MLTEDDMVRTMCEWLKGKGYSIERYCLGTQPGHDIEAVREGRTMYVECKGGTSRRTGQPLSTAYQWSAVTGAFFNQVRLRETYEKAEVGIALPDGGRYPEYMEKLKDFCHRNGIRVFWVSKTSGVKEWFGALPTVPADAAASRRFPRYARRG